MMKNGKNIIWGIFFVVLAAFVILGSLDMFGDFSIWTAVFAGLCVMWFIAGLIKISFGNMLFPLAFIAILFDKELNIESLTPWPVLCAAMFGTIGLNLMFGGKKKSKVRFEAANFTQNGVEETGQSNERFDCDLAFGSTVRYVNCQNLKFAKIDNAFGNCTIYFDNARLNNQQATVSIETSFGKTTLYVPRDWNVEINVSRSFGGVTERGQCDSVGMNVLMLSGEVAFGNLEIIYV